MKESPRRQRYYRRPTSWKDAADKDNRPTLYALVLMDVGGKSPIAGWWTGHEWFGVKLKPNHKVYYWKYGSYEVEKS